MTRALLKGDDFEELFSTFEHTAFRLEVRESYGGMPYEIQPLRQFLAGEEVDVSWTVGWTDMVRARTATGCRFERVRVVSEPHSDYTRYGLWLAHLTVGAGEDIRYLPRHRAASLPDFDYWLLDSCRLYRLHFDDADNLMGAELIRNPTEVAAACAARDAAWHYAIPRNLYAHSHGIAEPSASA